MDIVTYIKARFSETTAIYDTIGNDRDNGIIGCGFLRKNSWQQNNIDSVFSYYSGVLIIEGSGRYIDEDGTSVALYPGCFIQRIPGRKHSTLVNMDGKWLEAFLCLGKGLYEALAQIGLIKQDKPVLYTGLDSLLLEHFAKLFDEQKSPTFSRINDYLIRVQKIIFLAHELDAKNSGEKALSLIEHACKLIEHHVRDNITAKEIARRLNVSYETFRKLFKAKKGVPPHEYIVRKRIDTAKTMLLQGKAIGEIALELGYCDSFAFSKQFKKVAGISPSQFRINN
ncbi:MAG: helix-turn-helix transcriptional regulator [Clostridiaceae bacterium]|nr:helix-turn-helix transcriptional regulator [Clostridiaceae bacterium]